MWRRRPIVRSILYHFEKVRRRTAGKREFMGFHGRENHMGYALWPFG